MNRKPIVFTSADGTRGDLQCFRSVPPRSAPGHLRRWFAFLQEWTRNLQRFLRLRAKVRHKALAVRESTALGDRRFVAVVQFEQQRFLIASSPATISLLAQLPDDPASETLLHGMGEQS